MKKNREILLGDIYGKYTETKKLLNGIVKELF